MRKVFNFSAGPAMLPEPVLLEAQKELLDWQGTGMSMMELGHRGPEFHQIVKQSEADLRELMAIPANYQILFLAGGASMQFSMVPLNLFRDKRTADYVDTGVWSKKAIQEAQRFGEVHIASKTQHRNHLAYIPAQTEWSLREEAAYVHYTPNETIDGIEFHWVPQTGSVPLVADMTSMLLSRPLDVSQFGIIYAGTQKNAGQAGLTIVIIREDLIQEPTILAPTLCTYKVNAEQHSLYNTPPTYSWYITSLVLNWMKQEGGIEAIYQKNLRKAAKLYQQIDTHADIYLSKVSPECRSIMNVMFHLQNEQLTTPFIKGAEELGLTNLRGHRASGGVRASIYNAMPEEGVDILANYMDQFAKQHR